MDSLIDTGGVFGDYSHLGSLVQGKGPDLPGYRRVYGDCGEGVGQREIVVEPAAAVAFHVSIGQDAWLRGLAVSDMAKLVKDTSLSQWGVALAYVRDNSSITGGPMVPVVLTAGQQRYLRACANREGGSMSSDLTIHGVALRVYPDGEVTP